jgi:hypothetical protein
VRRDAQQATLAAGRHVFGDVQQRRLEELPLADDAQPAGMLRHEDVVRERRPDGEVERRDQPVDDEHEDERGLARGAEIDADAEAGELAAAEGPGDSDGHDTGDDPRTASRRTCFIVGSAEVGGQGRASLAIRGRLAGASTTWIDEHERVSRQCRRHPETASLRPSSEKVGGGRHHRSYGRSPAVPLTSASPARGLIVPSSLRHGETIT